MPSGPPELHRRWKSDANAIAFLKGRGFRLTKSYDFVPPSPDYRLTDPDEISALDYLVLEWDYGSLVNPPPE